MAESTFLHFLENYVRIRVKAAIDEWCARTRTDPGARCAFQFACDADFHDQLLSPCVLNLAGIWKNLRSKSDTTR